MIYANFKSISEVKVRDEGMVVADFSGVKAGTKFKVKEHYGKGVMVAWEGEDHTNFRGEQNTDGFGEDELHYLAFKGLPGDRCHTPLVKTSRSLIGGIDEPFRIEDKKVYEDQMYDLVWQANGPEDEIFMLMSHADALKLMTLLENKFGGAHSHRTNL